MTESGLWHTKGRILLTFECILSWFSSWWSPVQHASESQEISIHSKLNGKNHSAFNHRSWQQLRKPCCPSVSGNWIEWHAWWCCSKKRTLKNFSCFQRALGHTAHLLFGWWFEVARACCACYVFLKAIWWSTCLSDWIIMVPEEASLRTPQVEEQNASFYSNFIYKTTFTHLIYILAIIK